MEITNKVKERLENRIKDLEDLIEERGFGSHYLNRAKKVQRNINVSIFIGSVITVAGIVVWMLNRRE